MTVKEFIANRWVQLICWVIYLTLLFPLFGFFSFTFDIIILLYSVSAVLLSIGICIFFLSLLSHIGRDDDKHLFVVYGFAVLVTLKTFYVMYIPSSDASNLVHEGLSNFLFIDQLTGYFIGYAVLFRAVYWKNKENYERTNRLKTALVFFGYATVLFLISTFTYLYGDVTLFHVSEGVITFLLCTSAIIAHLKEGNWKTNLFEFAFFMIAIGMIFVEVAMDLALYFESLDYFLLRILLECSTFLIILISFMFSTYLVNKSALSGKKTLLINNIKLSLAKERLERALNLTADKETRISTIMENVTDALITIDENLKIESFNKSAEQMFGYKRREVIGHSALILVPNEYVEETRLVHHKAFNDNVVFKPRETYRKRKDGSIFPTLITNREIKLEKERLFVAIVRDITEERKQKEEMEEIHHNLIIAKDDAETANKMKTQLLANITHELRTPMNSILGFSKLINKHLNNVDKIEEYSNVIHSNGRRLLSLINSILDLSSVESGQTKLHFSTFNVKELAKVIDVLVPLKKDKNISLSFRVNKELPKMIRTDEEKVFQILINLAGNAIKYTDAGEVTIHLLPHKNNQILFKVEDTGLGISEDHLRHIFDDFYQIRGESQKHKGSGLGLSISKQLAEMLGGEIWVESELNQGTTFYFTIDNELDGIVPNEPLDHSFDLEKIEKIAKKSNTQIQEELELGNFMSVFERYQEEPILLLSPDSLKKTILQSFGMLPVSHFSDEEPFLMKNSSEFSIAFIFAETPHKRALNFLKAKGIVSIIINSLQIEPNKLAELGFSDVISFPIKDDEVDEILLKYAENYSQDSSFEESYDGFLVNSLKEILTIQFFRKSDILRELNELIVNSPKKYHKSLKQCIKDVESHNKDKFYKNINEMISK